MSIFSPWMDDIYMEVDGQQCFFNNYRVDVISEKIPCCNFLENNYEKVLNRNRNDMITYSAAVIITQGMKSTKICLSVGVS